MRKEINEIVDDEGQRAYLTNIRHRARRSRWGTRVRYVSIHASWLIVLLAGAAISLVEVFEMSRWVPAVLGFVIVVFQGIDRLFEKTADGAMAMDVLRRGLEREQRKMLVGIGPYEAVPEDERADVFTQRCEALIAENDETMVRYYADLSDRSDVESGTS